jgi:hypothetical protein
MGDDGNGGHVIRYEGTSSDFGFTLAANSEAEAEGEMADYAEAVDAVMSEESWA